MNITIIQVGKTKNKYFQEAENEYIKRLQPTAKLNIITLKEYALPAGSPQAGREIAKDKEAAEILKNLPPKSFIIALDEKGKFLTSIEFADFIKKKRDFEGANITFIIGGPYGLSTKIFEKVDLKLSFSAFTYTHEIIRTLLLEQIYRAFSIIAGKTYHY